MSNSILTSTKKALGIAEEYEAFDPEIIMHINSVLNTVTQLGIGPEIGFMITDASTEWPSFLGTDLRVNQVKTYVFLRVRMLFDPPSTSFYIAAMEKQIQELEWRMNVQREAAEWTDPDPTHVLQDDFVIDGGGF